MKYRTICADPPWPYAEGWPGFGKTREQRRPLPYASMTLDEIKQLPVRGLLEQGGNLFLWTTNRYLEESFSVARAWGCVPQTVLVWTKEPMGKGPGGMFAITTEFVIVARRGGPRSHARFSTTTRTRIDTSWFRWRRPYENGTPCHSKKPQGLQDLIEQVSQPPYLELFAREHRLGWDVWGNESANTAEMPSGVCTNPCEGRYAREHECDCTVYGGSSG